MSSRQRRAPWPTSARIVVGTLAVAAAILSAWSIAEDTGIDRRTEAPSEPRRPPGEPTDFAGAAPTGSGAPSTPASGAAGALVDTLVVAAPDPALPRYERDRFGDDWSYDPTSGCNTRERVLIEESLVPVVVDSRCRPTGRWVSAYDGLATSDIADLQIDHLVPLADAWRSGAAAWTDERRLAFANDLTQPGALIAVTGTTNQSKSDSSPDRWLPPDRTVWCTYATDWVAVKAAWQLTVTPAEKATLVQVLAGC